MATKEKTVIRKCRLCGEEMPATALFKHWKDKHPEYWRDIHKKAGRKSKASTVVKIADGLPASEKRKVIAALAAANGQQKTKTTKPQNEAKTAEVKEEQQIKGRFITKIVDLPGDILVLYWLAKAAFPEYDANEGEWIADCVRQFYAEHSEELGLNKLFDKTYEAIPLGRT